MLVVLKNACTYTRKEKNSCSLLLSVLSFCLVFFLMVHFVRNELISIVTTLFAYLYTLQ